MLKKIFCFLLVSVTRSYSESIGIFQEIDKESAAEDEECLKNINELLHSATIGELWALKIIDASTKIPAGILTGHLIDYGNFDECFNTGAKFKTQYCQAKIDLPPDFKNLITGNDSDLTSSLALRWSYCIPASCPAAFLENTLQKILKKKKLIATVYDSDCQTSDEIKATPNDYIGISFCIFFVIIAVCSTFYDILYVRVNKNKANQWLISFSIYNNALKLLEPEKLLPLQGLRFLSVCWVILGHRYFFAASSSLLNFNDFKEELKKIQSQFYIQGVLAVDTFFLLSGFLNGYILMKKLEKTGKISLSMYYIKRYIRLTPPLAFIVIMYATWYYLLGNGPAWKQTTLLWKQLCVENWIPTLLYVNNYYNPVAQCVGHSWYLAVDMQLYWVSPLIILPISKWPKMKFCILGLFLILSTISQFVIAYENNARMAFTFGLNSTEFERITKMIYTPTHMRATPFIIGVIFSYCFRSLKADKPFPKIWVGLLWFFSTVISLTVILGNYQFSRPLQDHPYNGWESSSYIAFHRIAWGVSIGWVILACLTGHGSFVSDILSCPVFVPLSKLTFCIYLTHMAIQQYHVGTARTSNYFQNFNIIHSFFGDLCFSIISATGLYSVIEAPVKNLKNIVIDKFYKLSKENIKNKIDQTDFHDSSCESTEVKKK